MTQDMPRGSIDDVGVAHLDRLTNATVETEDVGAVVPLLQAVVSIDVTGGGAVHRVKTMTAIGSEDSAPGEAAPSLHQTRAHLSRLAQSTGEMSRK